MAQSEKPFSPEEMKGLRKQLGLNILASVVLPWIAYEALSYSGFSAFVTLSVALFISAAWTIVSWIWQRQANWIGLLSVFGFAIAYTLSLLSGENTALLKIHSEFVFGPLGAALLLSALINKPLLLPLLEVMMPKTGNKMATFEEEKNDPKFRRKIVIATVALGIVLLLGAAIDIWFAFTASVSTLGTVDEIVSWGTIIIVIFFVRGPIRKILGR